MIEYKKRLEHKRKTMIILVLLLLVVSLGTLTYFLLQKNTAVFSSSFASGVQSGFFIGIFSSFTFQIVKITKTLQNEESLKKSYIAANDERNIEISRKVSYNAFLYTNFLLGLATIVAGFFNNTVFITLGFTLLGHVLLYIALLIYARKKS